MKVVVYPADRFGCGHHRLIWPAELLRASGHDVTVVSQESRHLEFVLDQDNVIRDVRIDPSVDVVVFQRVTHRYLAQAVSVIRRKGIAVVIDVDDDLSTIHPANPAWKMLHPENGWQFGMPAAVSDHAWRNLEIACRDATLVTCTTPALVERYGGHGRVAVLPNYLADHYFGIEHTDSAVIGWPASLESHPNDPDALGSAVARMVRDEGARFHVTSTSRNVGRAFGLQSDDEVDRMRIVIDLLDWPHVLAERIGIGIAPLADTKFNAAKSWLKPLELAAVGVPWVASPRAEYKRLHELGCGLLADRPDKWFKILRALHRSESFRTEQSEAGRAVAEQLRLRDHAWKWWEAWDRALGLQRRVGAAQSPLVRRGNAPAVG